MVLSRRGEMTALCEEVRERCPKLLVLQAPVATDLRIVVAALRAVGDPERGAYRRGPAYSLPAACHKVTSPMDP